MRCGVVTAHDAGLLMDVAVAADCADAHDADFVTVLVHILCDCAVCVDAGFSVSFSAVISAFCDSLSATDSVVGTGASAEKGI